jgi:hypothetical protein
MRVSCKVIGLAGLAGVAATGVVLARRRRAQNEYGPEELRERLHSRLADVTTEQPTPSEAPDSAPQAADDSQA